ncbi:MAG: ABC transporter substrate-binding protein [Candidatus Tectimicrobiota bacterium]
MSYHAPWEWTDEQLRGFQEPLKGLPIEYKIFQMDTKNNSSSAWKEEVGRQARQLIDTWQPDLVYSNDDNAQEFVAKYYVNTATPFVFSGVNADPAVYGFRGSSNVTGVLEHEHFVQTINLLKEVVPRVQRIAVILDKDPTWAGVVQRMQAEAPLVPSVQFVSWDIIDSFDEYKQKIQAYQQEVDALALLGIFTFKDATGKNVPYPEVLRWTAEHSQLPDFSFWDSRVGPGTLCAVTVSGYEQGLAAGKIAYGILAEGRSPASYPMAPTVKGAPVISLARAKKLGIPLSTGVLLTAKIFEKFAWE